MNTDPDHLEATPGVVRQDRLRAGLYLSGTFILFIFAIKLMVVALSHLGSGLSDVILLATANPFNGLFIGLLVTAILQSSSTTTSLLVAFVASGAMTVEGAVPIIMGANVGTTITSTIVSLGFVNKKKEFKRGVAAGSFHDFFNILTTAVLFPLEYYYQVLSRASSSVALSVFNSDAATSDLGSEAAATVLERVVAWMNNFISPVIIVGAAMALLFLSILLFRRIVSNILKVKHPEFFKRFFFNKPVKSFAWGVVLTGAIRSSTITTSLVVPIVAKNLVQLRKAAPFILGANIGTTISAFIAFIFYANSREAFIIALVHLCFNITGIVLFGVVPIVRDLPLKLAMGLGKLTMRHRIAGFAYVISTFFLIPFILIALSRDPEKKPDRKISITSLSSANCRQAGSRFTFGR